MFFHIDQSKINVVVQCFGADRIFPTENSFPYGFPCTGIHRSVCFVTLLLYISEKLLLIQGIYFPPAVLPVGLILRPRGLCLKAQYFSVIQRRHSLPNNISDCVGCAAKLLGYSVCLPAIPQPHLNYHIIFVFQVFPFFMFCVIIGVVHSDCLFLCVFCVVT